VAAASPKLFVNGLFSRLFNEKHEHIVMINGEHLFVLGVFDRTVQNVPYK
jgi:hypothetical protein